MENVKKITTAVQAATTANAAAPANINIKKLGVPVNVVVASVVSNTTPCNYLKSMEQDRIDWEKNELAASDKRLYSILKEAQSFYEVMKTHDDKDVRKAHADSLAAFIKERKYVFTPSTHDMTRVVKCVFGVDRRRVSAYSIALREALRQGITAEDLVKFLEDNGGVEQIRMGGTKPLSAGKRAALVKAEVCDEVIGSFKFDNTVIDADPDWNDKQVVIIATYLPNGEFEANAVIKHDGAVNAALAAFYSQQQAKKRADEKKDKDATDEAEKAEKEALKVKEAVERNAEKMAKQIAKVKALKAEQERLTANLEIAQPLFEGALA